MKIKKFTESNEYTVAEKLYDDLLILWSKYAIKMDEEDILKVFNDFIDSQLHP